MPVSNDEYLRRSIRNLKAGITGLQQRWAIVRALQRQLAAVAAIAAKEGITDSELTEGKPWKLAMVRTDLPTSGKVCQVGGEGVVGQAGSQNLNQSLPDSKNSQSVTVSQETANTVRDLVMLHVGDGDEVGTMARSVLEGHELKAVQEWPSEDRVRVLGTCPNPNVLKGALSDGRGVSLWAKGLGNVRVGSVVECVKVKDGEYRRK